jgi:hypothetical protein
MSAPEYDLLCPQCGHVSQMPTFTVYFDKQELSMIVRAWTFGEAERLAQEAFPYELVDRIGVTKTADSAEAVPVRK